MQPPILAKNRAFDYLEKRGLEKITDVNAGDWHIYILKELIDNALDADEAAGLAPRVHVTFAYRSSGHLLICVANAARFPAAATEKLFALQTYASVKDFFNGVTRGQQGNGLKTVLGIPYALQHFSEGNYQLAHVPLCIETGNEQRYVWYEVDAQSQQAHVRTSVKAAAQSLPGTRLTAVTSRFAPQPPPALEEVGELARKYALFNPFASFDWKISVDEEAATLRFDAQSPPRPLNTPASLRWYRFDQFARLCTQLSFESAVELPGLLGLFMHLDEPSRQKQVLRRLASAGIRSLADLDDMDRLRTAYRIAGEFSPQVAIERLGEAGTSSIAGFAARELAAQGQVCYRSRKEYPAADACAPYVLELFMLRSPLLCERTLWTGVNFTPLYKDPFYRKRFTHTVDGKQTEVTGFERVLQACGIEADDNVLVGLHLVSPNIEFQSYGKAEFDCRLIEKPLLEMTHQVAAEFQQVNRVKPHERLLLAEIGEAARLVSSGGRFRFTVPQLYRRTCDLARRGSSGGNLPADAFSLKRFQTVLLPEHEEQCGRIVGLIGNHKAKFLAPTQPFNSVLWIMKEGFEDVFIRNNLMELLQLAVVWGEADAAKTWAALENHLEPNKSYTVLALHDADLRPCLEASRFAHLPAVALPASNCRFVDLGLWPAQAEALGIAAELSPAPIAEDVAALRGFVGKSLSAEDFQRLAENRQRYDLNELSAERLIDWIHTRYVESGILHNETLAPHEVREQLSQYVLRLVRSHIERRLSDELALESAVDRLASAMASDLAGHDAALLARLQHSPPPQWKQVIDAFVADFVDNRLHAAEIRRQVSLPDEK